MTTLCPSTPAATPRVLHMETPAFAPLAAALLRGGTSLRFRAAGRSMHPTICDGDLLTVRPIAATGWRRGEVLLCLGSGGDVVAHRLLRIDRGGGKAVRLAIRGDAACGACDWIPPESVLGCVTVRERGGRQQSLDRPLPRLVGLIRAARQSLRAWWRGIRSQAMQPNTDVAKHKRFS